MYPILLEIGGITIYTYGFTMMVALSVIYFMAARRRHESPLSVNDLDNIGLIVLLSIWIGGTLVYSLIGGQPDTDDPTTGFDFKRMHHLGTTSIIIAFGVSLFFYCWWRKKPFMPVLDFLTPFFVLGYGIQRTLGCFLAGDSYGTATSMPWGVIFPDSGGAGPPPGIAVHPTQLYMGGAAFLTFWILENNRHWRHNNNTVSGFGMIGIFGSYFLVSFFRGDLKESSILFGLGIGPLFSLCLFIAGTTLFICTLSSSNNGTTHRPFREST